MIVKIKIDNHIITRAVQFVSFGNFVMNVIRYKNKRYLIGEGDEYLRGYERERIYTLGRCLS